MNKLKLDNKKQDELIKNVKESIFRETNVDLTDAQVVNILKAILGEIETSFYDPALLGTQLELTKKLECLLDIQKEFLLNSH